MSRTKRAWSPSIAIVALLLTGCSSPPPQTTPKLVGAWRSSVQFKDGAFAAVKDLEFLYSFNAGGTMTESSNYDGSPPVPPAYGIWREVGPNQFEAKYVFYNTKPPAHFDELAKGGGWSPAGRGDLTERITLSADGQTCESTITLDMFDQAGKAIEEGGHASGHGTRIRF